MDSEQLERTLGTVHSLLQAESMDDAANIVRTYPARAVETGYDNWNGGTTLWEVQFDIPPAEYARLATKRSHIEEQIARQIKKTQDSEPHDWYSAKIRPALELRKDWRAESSGIPRDIRVNIFDGLRLEKVHWAGAFDDVEFLSRIYDLQKLRSGDRRFEDAAGDIWQHRINNEDWDDDWVYSDDRFNLLDGPPGPFLRFLCEIVHPVVRPDRDQALRLVSHFNDQLRQVGWELIEEEKIAGRPRFTSRRIANHGSRAVTRAKTVAAALEAGWMEKEIERVERAVEQDPALAIGTAKELVETCCKTILNKRGVAFSKTEDLGDLAKRVAKELSLVPTGITDEVKGADNIRRILANLSQMPHNLAALRGLYGSGHGRDGRHQGLQPRHARLAVATAVAFIDFVTETFRYHESSKPTASTLPTEPDKAATR